MEKELKDTIEVLMYRLIKAGQIQKNADNLILQYGGKSCDLTFAKEARRKAEQEAGEVRDELFETLVLSENREGAISNQAFCDNYEILIQRIWGASHAIKKIGCEIVETKNPKLEAYLRKKREECQAELERLKKLIIEHLMSSYTM